MECRITALPVLPAPRRNLQPSKKALVKPNSLKETYFVLKINLLLLSQEPFLHSLLLNTTLSASKSFTPVIFTRKQEGLKHRSTFSVTERKKKKIFVFFINLITKCLIFISRKYYPFPYAMIHFVSELYLLCCLDMGTKRGFVNVVISSVIIPGDWPY